MTLTSCIVSVEKLPGDSYGTIKLVCGNKAYIASIEDNKNAPKMIKNTFVPGSPYTDYLPQDLNFEHACYQAAVLHQPIHSYVHPDRFDFWLNMFFIPLESDDEKTAYCIYSMEFSRDIKSEKMSEISGKTSAKVLETCIKLSGSNDFKKTMQEVVRDIRM